MKTNHVALSLLSLLFACSCIAAPLPTDPDARREEIRKRVAETPRPKGYVFQPERTYENDFTTLLMQYEVVYGAAQSLANLTSKEVFVSHKIQHYTVPHIDAKGSRAMVALELIRSIESIEGANIVVVELGGSTLAIIQRSPDPVKRP